MHGGATCSYLLCTTYIRRVFNEQISRYGPANARSFVSLCNICRMNGLHRHSLILSVQLHPSRQILPLFVPDAPPLLFPRVLTDDFLLCLSPRKRFIIERMTDTNDLSYIV